MAWMKSKETGKYYLTGEFTQRSNIPQAEASGISAALGFATEEISNANISAELTRVAENRAALIADIVKAIPASGGTIDYAAVAKAVNDDAARRMVS